MLLKVCLISFLILCVSAATIGNLAKYKDDSARRAKLPVGTNQVVFLGSSMCEWWNPFFPGKPYVNRGIAGETTSQFISRFQQDVLALKPKVVVIYGASNDIAGKVSIEDIQANFRTLHNLAKTNNIRIVQASLTPVCGDKKAGRPPATILKLNAYLKSFCATEYGCEYADFHTALVNKTGEIDQALTTDCMHPSTKAYAIMAPIAEKAIAKALAGDKGNLEKYKVSSAQLSKKPAGTNQAVFIGGSIVQQWTPFFPNKPYVNRGIGGETTEQFISRFQQDVIALKPKVVVILGGSNDIAGNTGVQTLQEIQANFQIMHELARVNKIKVIQVSLTPVCGTIKTGRPPKTIVALNSSLKTLCESSKNCVYADVHTALVNKQGEINKDLTKDCLNVNNKGYAIMTPIIEKAIKKTF